MSLPAQQSVVYLTGPRRLELRREPLPRPGPGEILLWIGAATTCGTDVKVYRRGGHPRMLRVPCPFGHELAGAIAALGAGVTSWREGQRVVVLNSASCGRCAPCRRGRENLCEDLHYLNGAFAEYILVPARFVERSLYALDAALGFELAALTEPLACVLHGIECCALSEPAAVLVLGAGPIGLLFAGALAAAGHRVTAADPNPGRLDVARRLGAAQVVAAARHGGQALSLRESSPGAKGYEVVIEATGVAEVWSEAMAAASPGGQVILFGGCAPGTQVPLDTHHIHYGEIAVKGAYHHRPATARRALELLSARAFDAGLLLSSERPLAELGEALESMMRREALKVVIRG
jgi:L-iditol 2-dehydrogenase